MNIRAEIIDILAIGTFVTLEAEEKTKEWIKKHRKQEIDLLEALVLDYAESVKGKV